ncbi:MAG TPA: methyltransferase domain-containing protein [Ktedonobacterales bacterium]|jgi:methylase of polypeptide subunit release factors|nr:methyltransferase domain-containing protein [Ktedonobacterales bacterium]
MAGESDIPPTWGTQLARAERILGESGSLAPRQDAIELLSYALGVPAPVLRARPASSMTLAGARMYDGLVARRATGEALPHITGHLEFMGLDITVEQWSPLAPPGAQRLVATALQWARRRAPGELAVAEIGTGCGAIALALAALEPRFTCIYAAEPSPQALEAARANGARYLLNLVISWLQGEDLDVVPEPVDLIVCGHPDWADLKQAAAKLRPGGALICVVDDAERPVTDDLPAHGFSLPVWVEDQDDEPAIAVAQLSHDQEGS